MYRRRIISCLSVFVIILSLFSFPAYATVGDGAKYIVDQFWSMIHRDWDGVDVAPTAIVNVLKEFLRSSITPETATDEDWKNAYDDYVNDVKTQTGTATLIDGGIRLLFNLYDVRSMNVLPGSTLSGSYINITAMGTTGANLQLLFYGISAPFNSYCTTGGVYSVDNFSIPSVTYLSKRSIQKGSEVQPFNGTSSVKFPVITGGSFCSFSGYFYADFIPYVGVVGDYYNIDLTNSTRPTVITGPIGYYDASNNLQVINNTTIVNETNNTFFNPITNTKTNLTNWAYDYSNRSYTLTLDTGDKVSVTYGDENITIIEGGTTYNVYYVYSSDNSGGGNTDTSGFFAWWKTEWANFRAWLASVLPGGDSTTVPEGALPNLPGETEGDSGFSILDIIKKIVSALWKLVSGFFGTIFGGVFQFFVSLGDNIDGFFSVFDSDDGVFGFGKYGGADIWD